MNFLRVLTKPESANTFVVHWTNSTQAPRGALRVIIPPDMEDGHIIAELHALQHLLEVAEVIGNNSAGNENTRLIVSLGAIKKLSRMASDKQSLAEYAKFLTTRFKECPIEVDKSEIWITVGSEPSITLDASVPMDEIIHVHGAGDVLLTSHVVEKFAERCGIAHIGEAWRKLRKIAAEQKVREIEKNNPNTRLKYAIKRREEGRYFHHTTQDLILVVAKNSNDQPALVTVYKVTQPE